MSVSSYFYWPLRSPPYPSPSLLRILLQRLIFQSDPSSTTIYFFLSFSHHKSAWISHFQWITAHRSLLFWKSHYLFLFTSHFSPLFCYQEAGSSFLSISTFLSPQDLVSLPTTLLNTLSGRSPRASLWLNPQTLLYNRPPSSVVARGCSSAPSPPWTLNFSRSTDNTLSALGLFRGFNESIWMCFISYTKTT